MAWSTAFAPAVEQRHYRYNVDVLAQVNTSTAPFHRIPLIPDLRGFVERIRPLGGIR
jgi:hypothetical protein